MGLDLVVFPMHDWKKYESEGFRTRDAHLIQHFAVNDRVNKILVINRPMSLTEMMIKRMDWKINSGDVVYKNNFTQLSKIDEKTYVLDIFVFDTISVLLQRKNWWYSVFKKRKVIEAIKKAIETINISDSTFLIQNPMAVEVVKAIDHKFFIFDAIDNWLHHPQMKSNKNIVANNYEYIKNSADVIFTVSKSLQDFFMKDRKDVYWVSNGVDKNYFRNAVKNYAIKDNDCEVVVGYVGKIQERVDIELVDYLCENLPDFKFIFLGPILSKKREFINLSKKYDNLKFLGDIHYNQLPQQMKNIDIAIIPHKVNEFTNSMNPLKLFEYLASGKPVITTGVAGTEDVSEYIYLANSKDEFVKTIKDVSIKIINGKISAENVVKSVDDKWLWDKKTNEIIDIIIHKSRNDYAKET